MISNAHDARELARKSTDPKLQKTLELIEVAAGRGEYSLEFNHDLSIMLVNNLKSRGFSIYQDRKITW